MDQNKLSPSEIDIFKEMGSIGSGNAATALSQMINKRVTIKPVKTQIIPIEDIPEEIGGAETIVMSVYLRVMGDLTGDAVYLHPKDEAISLIKLITGNDKIDEDNFDDSIISAYKEMSNILTGAYLNAISSMLDIMIIPSIPHYASDMLGALIDFIISEIGQKIDSVLIIKTYMNIDYKDIGGGYLMIFNPDSLTKMIDIIHKKYDLDGRRQ